MTQYRVLIIDDDRLMRNSLMDLLQAAGWATKDLARATDVDRWVAQFQPDVILSDVRMPEVSGLDLLQTLETTAPIVLVSAHGDIPMAVEAMHNGAYSFVEKPFDPNRLLAILSHAADQHRMRESNGRLRARLHQLSGLDRVLIGQSPSVRRLRDMITAMADGSAPVLIRGETGTGKDVVARALHDMSARCDGPFVAISAAQVSPEQLSRIARSADGGTLFLDEVCAFPEAVQASLLRVIETGEHLDPDTGQTDQLDLRIVSATNQDTEEAVRDGRLRQDLLFRLDALPLPLPPLRDRLDDIALLATHFLEEFASAYGAQAPVLRDEDVSALFVHDWPGNVRELRNVVARWVATAALGREGVAEVMPGGALDEDQRPGLREAVAAFERQVISRALQSHAGRMDDVAAALGIGRRTLNEKIVKLGLDKSALL